MNLISFVKLLPAQASVQIVYNQNVEHLSIKKLAEHQHDTVTGVDYQGESFVITVSPALTVPSPYLSACNCKA